MKWSDFPSTAKSKWGLFPSCLAKVTCNIKNSMARKSSTNHYTNTVYHFLPLSSNIPVHCYEAEWGSNHTNTRYILQSQAPILHVRCCDILLFVFSGILRYFAYGGYYLGICVLCTCRRDYVTVLLNKSQWVIILEIISGWIYWTQWMEFLCRVDSGKRLYCGETIGGRVYFFKTICGWSLYYVETIC